MIVRITVEILKGTIDELAWKAFRKRYYTDAFFREYIIIASLIGSDCLRKHLEDNSLYVEYERTVEW